MEHGTLDGPSCVIDIESRNYPEILREIPDPPKLLYCLGNVDALKPGVAIIGARKATPYGLSCAQYFATHAALRGVTVVSGGARGCDQEAHKAAVEVQTPTVAVFGSGADVPYPKSGRPLFQRIISQGGCIVSENPWGFPAHPWTFPRRNRIIAGLSVLLLIVEAGLPSGTLTTADEALAQGKDVCIVPSAITSPYAKGVNYLFSQGATPIVDSESFDTALSSAFTRYPLSMLQLEPEQEDASMQARLENDPILRALSADAYAPQELAAYFGFSPAELSRRLSEYELQGLVQRGRDGRYQVCLKVPGKKKT
jgi:DNA processing protein